MSHPTKRSRRSSAIISTVRDNELKHRDLENFARSTPDDSGTPEKSISFRKPGDADERGRGVHQRNHRKTLVIAHEICKLSDRLGGLVFEVIDLIKGYLL
jgi:hypothetical protein